MGLFDGEPLSAEADEAQPKRPTKREIAQRQAARRKRDREEAAEARFRRELADTARSAKPRRISRESLIEKWRSLAAIDHARRMKTMGVDPDATDADRRYDAELAERSELVVQGWTFIRGYREPMAQWLRDTEAERAAYRRPGRFA